MKFVVMGCAALAVALSGTANAAATRSADALPVVSKKAIKRTAPAMTGTRSKAEGDSTSIILGVGAAAAAIAGIIIATDNGNDSKG
ncbi:hypothetical protein OLX02_10505 [Novosphingobium sp. KCTC 2891]|uniref:hypothetical protein n=1 Tax=Novosphingobium sp. KCTC 2891 TaxID=2989730 RepID=UPI002222580C|nr:hypothetical protein [Novosphingobium sp. KCTC 2891]MCW1383253.1 hypothetical protein [Novosphingobium sp. KCTC 2891]